MAACPALASGDAFLGSLLGHIDCQARGLGAAGYQALSDPGSSLAVVLTGLLTLFVALIGLRMALGRPPTRAGLVMAVVRIGVVLALATSWSAYRTLVYDVVIDGPAELTQAIAAPVGLPGAQGDLVARLQRVDAAIVRLTDLGTGREPNAALPASEPGGAPRRFPVSDDPAFGWARVIFLGGIISAVSIVRLTAGTLLALTPLFAGLLLLPPARAFVAGWARTLTFCVLGSVITTVILGVELALLEPWLAQVLQARSSGALAASAPVELLVLCGAFSLCLFGSLFILLWLAFTVHLPAWPVARMPDTAPDVSHEPHRAPDVPPAAAASPTAAARGAERPAPRAAAIADSLMAAQRREAGPARADAAAPPARGDRSTETSVIAPTGAGVRRARPRQSLAAAYRDSRS